MKTNEEKILKYILKNWKIPIHISQTLHVSFTNATTTSFFCKEKGYFPQDWVHLDWSHSEKVPVFGILVAAVA